MLKEPVKDINLPVNLCLSRHDIETYSCSRTAPCLDQIPTFSRAIILTGLGRYPVGEICQLILSDGAERFYWPDAIGAVETLLVLPAMKNMGDTVIKHNHYER